MSRELPRIMIVDDDAVTCELLCEVFQRQGLDIAEALVIELEQVTAGEKKMAAGRRGIDQRRNKRAQVFVGNAKARVGAFELTIKAVEDQEQRPL